MTFVRRARMCAREAPASAEAATAETKLPVRGDMLVVAGLGNVGAQFAGTRHNAGWDAVSAYASRCGVKFKSERSMHASIAQAEIYGRTVLLVQPRTLMNASGRAVRAALKARRAPTAALLVVADDMSLEVGRVRLRARGSSGGHNGLKSVEQAVGGREYARLRVGVGEPRGGAAYWKDHVLERFSSTDRQSLDDAIFDCCDVIDEWVRNEDFSKSIHLLGRLMNNRKSR